MKRIDNLIKGHLSPLLKKNGFKKKKNLWNRNRGSFVDVIDVQEAKGSTASSERLTLNIGVFVPELYEAVWDKPTQGFAQEADCVVRFRLGALLQDDFTGKALDTWWDLNTDQDVDAVGLELTEALENKAFPFLDSMSDFKGLADVVDGMGGWQKQYPLMQLYLALIRKELGQLKDATIIVDTLLSGSNKAWMPHAQRVRARL